MGGQTLNLLIGLIPFLLLTLSASGFAQDLPFPVSTRAETFWGSLSGTETEYKVVFDFVMIDDNLDDPYHASPRRTLCKYPGQHGCAKGKPEDFDHDPEVLA